jgi:hypothetical protein
MEINFEAGPVSSDFMSSDAFFRLLAGPVGSGKTTTCLIELVRRAFEQRQSTLDGIRKTRFAICRQTLSQLKNTVLKDAITWFGPIASWKVSDSTIYFDFRDVKSEWLLLPLETPEDQRRILSLQLTGAMLSEAIETDPDLLGPIAGRCGRYPPPNEGGASWYGMIGDTNFPPEGSPWHAIMETPPLEYEIYKQPGGLEPEAENLNYLLQTPETMVLPLDHPTRIARGRMYYERLARSSNPDWVKRYVHAQYAPDPSGASVFRGMFVPRFHVVDAIEPIPSAPLLIGMDFGRDPVAVLGQLDWKGRLLILGECPAEDIGLTGQMPVLRGHLAQERYHGRRMCIVGDPSGQYKGNLDERTAFDVLKQHGFMAIPAPTNAIDPRLRCVEHYLLQQRDGGPAIMFDRRHCPRTIQAMGGAYRFKFDQAGEAQAKPEKNEASHYADALQYLCLGATGTTALQIARRLSRTSAPRPRMNAAGWT